MSGKVVSLSQARKAKVRADKKRQADANAVKFGRTKAEREAEEGEVARNTRDLDGHKRDDD